MLPAQFHNLLKLGMLIILALLSLWFSMRLGAVMIDHNDFWQALFSTETSLESRIIFDIRWPRTATAFITGSLLGLSGVLMQAMLRNPLADPYILGISGGAATAALLAISLGLSGIWLQPAALVGSAFAMLLVYVFAGFAGRRSDSPLLLTGVILAAGWGALINVILIMSDNHTVHAMLFWLMGDLSNSHSPDGWQLLILGSALLVSWWYGRDLNLLLLGEAKAFSLGSPVKKIRFLAFSIAAICTAIAVSLAGTVGFIGLIVPHMMRKVFGSNHRLLLPASTIAGGTLLTLADLGARNLIAPQQLPVGVITAMLGVPIFLYLLISRK